MIDAKVTYVADSSEIDLCWHDQDNRWLLEPEDLPFSCGVY